MYIISNDAKHGVTMVEFFSYKSGYGPNLMDIPLSCVMGITFFPPPSLPLNMRRFHKQAFIQRGAQTGTLIE